GAALPWPGHALAARPAPAAEALAPVAGLVPVLAWLGHAALILAVVLLAAQAGRWLARLLRQPEVIGEIVLGMVCGPALLALAGPDLTQALLPPQVLAVIRAVGHVGLILFLVAVVHELRSAAVRVNGRTVTWTAVGAGVVPLAAGGVLAAYVLLAAEPAVRGGAPAAPLAVFLLASLTVTAVPVLARILADKAAVGTRIGRISMTVAVIVDAGAWLLVVLAVGLMNGGPGSLPWFALLIAGGLAVTALARRLLAAARVTAAVARHPRAASVVVAGAALAAAAVMGTFGFADIFGAVFIGLAIPVKIGAWSQAVGTVARVGHRLVPVYFVVAGIAVFAAGLGSAGWTLIALCVALGIAGKVGGGYAGARMGGASRADSLLLGVLLNTRGLTELVVLQAGFAAGILTPALYAALVVMALVTTGLTGPAYTLLTRRHPVAEPVPHDVPPAAPEGQTSRATK
ncbi:cation:proton antiporter, partial [Nonomuraea sp. MCN248]